MKTNPVISVITVCYNSATTLAHTLQSVAEQDWSKVEHIVIDGASSDGTAGILGYFRPQLAHVLSEPDNGLYDAMNKGIGLATGDIVGILNADDFYTDEHVLSRVVDAFRNPAIDACYGDLVYVEKDSPGKIVRYWKSQPYNEKLFYRGWMPPHPTFFVRRKIYEQYGCFNLAMGTAADYELMLRFLLRHSIKASYIPALLVYMRCGGASGSSLVRRWCANRMDRKAWSINSLHPKPWTLLMKPLSKITQFFVRY